jgi:uncharacterized protein (DUF1330 family)
MTMAIDPRGADLKRLLAEDDGGPFVMLNLLRFADGKREQYDEYVRRASVFVKRYGGEPLYYGDGSTVLAAEPGQEWDAVVLVRYPSREAFSRMVADPQYHAISHLRTEALTEAVLQATTPRG